MPEILDAAAARKRRLFCRPMLMTAPVHLTTTRVGRDETFGSSRARVRPWRSARHQTSKMNTNQMAHAKPADQSALPNAGTQGISQRHAIQVKAIQREVGEWEWSRHYRA